MEPDLKTSALAVLLATLTTPGNAKTPVANSVDVSKLTSTNPGVARILDQIKASAFINGGFDQYNEHNEGHYTQHDKDLSD